MDEVLPLICGHVEGERRGDALFLRCTSCGAEELVADYERKDPQHFLWAPISFDAIERVTCYKCGKKHERVVPGAR